ncbi:DUF554 domain-containing protein [Lachnospiraceae bacterium OttesenSCG-928-E19]|nr:DUF554 domain-containing protein [Lachnospiraceae bacterium OttesenSCG-928-E19]
MPIGIIINCSAVFLGGIIGALLGHHIPQRVHTTLTNIFGICSISMGITYLGKLQNLPAVMLAIIIGTAIGEWCFLEKGIANGIGSLIKPMHRFVKIDANTNKEDFMEQFISIVVLFCASGTGIFGSIVSGMSGDHSILITKSVLDFFTAMIFAISLGALVSFIAVPQMLVMLVLFFCAGLIYPATTEVMRGDFSACGGVLVLATGLRISGIKHFPIANMIPAMILVMPFSYLWTTHIVPLLM